MSYVKRVVSYVCVWLGGNDPGQERMPAEHSWLVPGPSFLNSMIEWANPRPLARAAAPRASRP